MPTPELLETWYQEYSRGHTGDTGLSPALSRAGFVTYYARYSLYRKLVAWDGGSFVCPGEIISRDPLLRARLWAAACEELHHAKH